MFIYIQQFYLSANTYIKPDNFKNMKNTFNHQSILPLPYSVYKITMYFKTIFLPFSEGNEGTRPDNFIVPKKTVSH